MKRIVLYLSIMLLFLMPVWANSQKYYTVSSYEWQAVDDLCIYAGVLGPTSNGPVTASQLCVALDRAAQVLGSDYAPLKALREMVTDNNQTLGYDDSYLSLVVGLNGEGYYQTNPKEEELMGGRPVNLDSDWLIKGSKDRKPLFEVNAEMGIRDFFFARFVYDFRPLNNNSGIWDRPFSHNVTDAHSENFPYDSGVSIGTGNLSLIAAKARRSYGRGYTGNLAIGDVYDYQEFLRVGAYSRFFSTYLVVTNFDSSHSTSMTSNPFRVLRSKFSGFKSLRYEASIEVNLLKNFGFTFTLVNLADTESGLDLRALNPFYILHNMDNITDPYIESNNVMTFDISFVPFRRWQRYFQFIMDQSQSPEEVVDYEKMYGYVDPNAIGVLANITYSDRLGKGTMKAFAEFVYNAPGMYLNQVYYGNGSSMTKKNNGKPCWALDYLLGYHRVSQNSDDIRFSGYVFGPDVMVGSLGFVYRQEKRLSLSTRLLYMAHGEKGRGTSVSSYDFTGISSKDTYNRTELTGVVEHTAAVSAECEYWVTKHVMAYLGAAYAFRWNAANVEGETRSNLQVAFGLTIKGNLIDLARVFFKGI